LRVCRAMRAEQGRPGMAGKLVLTRKQVPENGVLLCLLSG
jgi:hypothetical protein